MFVTSMSDNNDDDTDSNNNNNTGNDNYNKYSHQLSNTMNHSELS